MHISTVVMTLAYVDNSVIGSYTGHQLYCLGVFMTFLSS